MKKHLPLLLALLLLALPVWAAQAEVSLPGALTVISDQAFEGNAAFSGVIELPGGVSAVGNQAFKNTDIFGLKLPAAVRRIGTGILESSGTTYAIVAVGHGGQRVARARRRRAQRCGRDRLQNRRFR